MPRTASRNGYSGDSVSHLLDRSIGSLPFAHLLASDM